MWATVPPFSSGTSSPIRDKTAQVLSVLRIEANWVSVLRSPRNRPLPVAARQPEAGKLPVFERLAVIGALLIVILYYQPEGIWPERTEVTEE